MRGRQHRLAENCRDHLRRGWSFRLFLHGRRPLVECIRTVCCSVVLLPPGLRTQPNRPAPLDCNRRHPDAARKLECGLDLGGTEHSVELRTHPHRATYVQTFLKNRGWLAFAVIVSVLLALLPVAGTLPTTAQRDGCGHCSAYASAGISTAYPRARRRAKFEGGSPDADRDRYRWADAPFGVSGRRGRLRLAGTKGIFVSGRSFRRGDSWASGFCPPACACSYAARAASNPQSR